MENLTSLSQDSEREEQQSENEAPPPKKSKTKGEYVRVNKKFSSRGEAEAYMRAQNKFKMRITNNQQVNCSLCGNNQHKKNQIYFQCMCKKIKTVLFGKCSLIQN